MPKFSIESFRMYSLPSQDEIMSTWTGERKKPLVSIVCTAYNQEQYIEDTIRGFLFQKTSFPFEIIFHDDASTDSTSEIIRHYKEQYPDLIKPIFQTENQYSKSPNSVLVISSELAQGEYIALCEGDDFWIDEIKLEKQVKLLNKHSGVNICFTSGVLLFSQGTQNKSYKHANHVKIFTPDEVIKNGGGFMPTCSLLIHNSVFKKLPDWFCDTAPVGDVFLQILAALDKGALYLPDFTCMYRVAAEGSWTLADEKCSKDLIMSNRLKSIFCFEAINKNTNFTYESSFQHVIALDHCSSAFKYLIESDYKTAKKYISLSWKAKKYISFKQFMLKFFFILSPVMRKYLLFRKKY